MANSDGASRSALTPSFHSAGASDPQARVEAVKGIYLFSHRKDKNKAMLKANNQHTTALKNSKVRAFRLYDLRHTWATRGAKASTWGHWLPCSVIRSSL